MRLNSVLLIKIIVLSFRLGARVFIRKMNILSSRSLAVGFLLDSRWLLWNALHSQALSRKLKTINFNPENTINWSICRN